MVRSKSRWQICICISLVGLLGFTMYVRNTAPVKKHYKNELWGLAGLSFAFKELARVRSTSTTVSDVWAIAIVHLWFHDFLLIQHRKITVCAMTFWQKVCFNKVLSKPQDSCGREVWVWRSDLRPIVKHQQRAICTATKAKMRDSHRGTHKGGQGPGE